MADLEYTMSGYSINKFLHRIINQYSCQPKEFCYYRPPNTFDKIKQAHDILFRNSNPFTNFGVNGYWIQSQSKPSWNYQLLVQDNLTCPDFKFVSCSCIGTVFSLNFDFNLE